MITCRNIMDLLDCFLPFDCVAAKDNTGLLIGDPEWPRCQNPDCCRFN